MSLQNRSTNMFPFLKIHAVSLRLFMTLEKCLKCLKKCYDQILWLLELIIMVSHQKTARRKHFKIILFCVRLLKSSVRLLQFVSVYCNSYSWQFSIWLQWNNELMNPRHKDIYHYMPLKWNKKIKFEIYFLKSCMLCLSQMKKFKALRVSV